MARISSLVGNPFYRTSYINGRVVRSTGQNNYSANLFSNFSTKNPSLTRKIFSNLIDAKSNATANAAKDSLNNADKKITDEKNVGKVLSTYFSSATPLYTGKSSLTPDYSSLGGLINYLL